MIIEATFITDSHWDLQAAFPPGAVDHGQGGRSQQLREGPLHHRQGADRDNGRQDQEDGGPVYWTAGISRLSFLRRRHWLRLCLPADGETLR